MLSTFSDKMTSKLKEKIIELSNSQLSFPNEEYEDQICVTDGIETIKIDKIEGFYGITWVGKDFRIGYLIIEWWVVPQIKEVFDLLQTNLRIQKMQKKLLDGSNRDSEFKKLKQKLTN